MDRALINRLVDAVLYEGYLLYPYRPALKNAKRWTFGALYPAESRAAHAGEERCRLRARVLVVGDSANLIEVQLRFLQLIERIERNSNSETQIWHECEERRIDVPPQRLESLSRAGYRQHFEFGGRYWHDPGLPLDSSSSVVRRQEALCGAIDVHAEKLGEDRYRLSVSITNETQSNTVEHPPDRNAAALQAFASTHLVLGTRGGRFISRIDPPEPYRDFCPVDHADGLWPVLIGMPNECDAVLCSPIILQDYPEIAPESPGDFFDGTEIDEMLALRIRALSPEEKLQMAALDSRARALLDRTEALTDRRLAELHGAVRSLRPIKEMSDE